MVSNSSSFNLQSSMNTAKPAPKTVPPPPKRRTGQSERVASRPRLAAATNASGRPNRFRAACGVERAASRGRLAVRSRCQEFSSTAFLVSLLLCASAASAPAALDQTVADLIPKLAAEKMEDRYAPQMELQALALKAARPGADAERADLAKLLAAKAADQTVPQPARVWIVRQLEHIGAHES